MTTGASKWDEAARLKRLSISWSHASAAHSLRFFFCFRQNRARPRTFQECRPFFRKAILREGKSAPREAAIGSQPGRIGVYRGTPAWAPHKMQSFLWEKTQKSYWSGFAEEQVMPNRIATLEYLDYRNPRISQHKDVSECIIQGRTSSALQKTFPD